MNTKQRILIIALIVLGIAIMLFFGLRALHAFRRIHEGGFGLRSRPTPSETVIELICGWMTIPYISRTYAVPGKFLFRELQIPEDGNQNKSLEELNNEYYPTQPDFVLKKVKDLISSHQPPPPPTP